MVLLNYIGLYIYIYAYKTKELKELIQEKLTVVHRGRLNSSDWPC